MSAFNPDTRCFLHDERSNREFVWKVERAANYREWAVVYPDGKVEWGGAILDGWRPFVVGVALSRH